VGWNTIQLIRGAKLISIIGGSLISFFPTLASFLKHGIKCFRQTLYKPIGMPIRLTESKVSGRICSGLKGKPNCRASIWPAQGLAFRLQHPSPDKKAKCVCLFGKLDF
jgi:hypothetical protein